MGTVAVADLSAISDYQTIITCPVQVLAGQVITGRVVEISELFTGGTDVDVSLASGPEINPEEHYDNPDISHYQIDNAVPTKSVTADGIIVPSIDDDTTICMVITSSVPLNTLTTGLVRMYYLIVKEEVTP